MNIITYHSANAKPHEAWLAYAELPNGEQWLVRFTGATEAEAVAKAEARWESEQKRYRSHNELEPALSAASFKSDGRGQAFAGKVWVINRDTQHLCRIDPGELDSYLAKGYVRGGPRSK